MHGIIWDDQTGTPHPAAETEGPQVVTHAMRVTNFSIQFENFGVYNIDPFYDLHSKEIGTCSKPWNQKKCGCKMIANLDLESTHQLLNWVSSKLWATRTSSTFCLVDHSTTNGWPLVSVVF